MPRSISTTPRLFRAGTKVGSIFQRAAQDLFGLAQPAERQVGRADGRQHVDVDALFAGGAQIGLQRKFVFARRHQAVADGQPVDGLATGIDAVRAVAADSACGRQAAQAEQQSSKPEPQASRTRGARQVAFAFQLPPSSPACVAMP